MKRSIAILLALALALSLAACGGGKPDSGSSGAGRDNSDFIQFFADYFQSVEKSCQSNHSGSVLVVMKDRNVTAFFQLIFDFKAAWRRDVFQIDSAKAPGQKTDGFYNIIDLLASDA